MNTSPKLINSVLEQVQKYGRIKARNIALNLNAEKCEVNRILYFVLKPSGKVYCDDNYHWVDSRLG